MRIEPGFNFSREFPALDKALKGIAPFIAAAVVFFVIYVIQAIVFIIILLPLVFEATMEMLELQVDLQFFYYIFPGIVAVLAFFRPHGSQPGYNTRFQSSARDVNVPFYDDPRQPTPEYRPRHNEPDEDDKESPDDRNA